MSGFILNLITEAVSKGVLKIFFLFCHVSDCDCVEPNTLYGNSTVCNETTGLCTCKPRIGGRRCDRCHENAYNTSRGCVGKCAKKLIATYYRFIIITIVISIAGNILSSFNRCVGHQIIVLEMIQFITTK